MLSPGIHRNVPFEAYLALPYASASDLKILRRSPWAYRYAKDHPESRESKAKANGTAAHLAILEPHRLVTDCAVWDGDRRGKEWKEFEAANAHLNILKRDEHTAVLAQRDAVRSHPAAMRYLAQGEAEVTIVWDDPETGIRCKGRIDWLAKVDGQTVITDLKTTASTVPHKFGSDAHKFGYHIQFGHYHQGWAVLTGEDARVVVLAVENKAPFEPAVFAIPADVLDQGINERDNLLRELRDCADAGLWLPSISDEQDLAFPRWAMAADEDDEPVVLGLSA